MKVACLWSGGKDSCLACWKAIAEGLDVCHLVNFVSAESGRGSFHGVRRELICMQSEAVGIPLIQRETTWESYEKVYRGVMHELRGMGIDGLVTGDMDVVEHQRWVEGICSEFGLRALMPLWGLDSEGILRGFIGEGFEAIVVCLKADLFDGKWLGRKIDEQCITDLQDFRQNPDFHICGENGEYHTFVVDGPIFQKRISLTHGDKVWREGYGFFDIDQAELTQKAKGNEKA